MCLRKVLSGQPGQNFISSHESEQSEALFLFPVSTHWTFYSSGGLGRHAVHGVLADTLTHMKHLTALMWPYVCSEAKRNKWEFSSLDFMAYVTGSGHGFALMCTDLAKPYLNWNLKIKVSGLEHWPWKKEFSDIKSMLSNKKSRQVLLRELGCHVPWFLLLSVWSSGRLETDFWEHLL